MIGCSFSLPIRSRLSELSSQSWHLNTQIIPDFMSVISTLSKYQRKFFFPPSCYRKVNQHLIKIIIESRRQSKFLILKKKLSWHPSPFKTPPKNINYPLSRQIHALKYQRKTISCQTVDAHNYSSHMPWFSETSATLKCVYTSIVMISRFPSLGPFRKNDSFVFLMKEKFEVFFVSLVLYKTSLLPFIVMKTWKDMIWKYSKREIMNICTWLIISKHLHVHHTFSVLGSKNSSVIFISNASKSVYICLQKHLHCSKWFSHIIIAFTSPDVPAFTLSPVYISTLYKQSPIFGSTSSIFFFNRGFGAIYSILGFADTGRFG